MGKRLIRISSDAITASEKDLLNNDANIVLKSGSVSNGTIIEINDSSITLKNKRRKKLRFELEEINEIIIDK